MESESLQPQLEIAQQTLVKALAEACGVDVRDIDTGELIRMEEMLTTATKAAKDAVSVRLKLRARRRQSAQPGDAMTKITQRIFDDIRGKRWRVYAVHPSQPSPERVALPEPYREGWLSFESAEETRRVAPIPAGWEEMTTDELRQICYKAPSTPKRISTNPSQLFKPKP